MNSDRAIENENEDRLGFGELANRLAKVINSQSVSDGFVIGIEGEWGSGKSCLVNLTRRALENLETNPPEIVFFSPWLIGNKENLWNELLEEITRCAIKIEPVKTNENSTGGRDYLKTKEEYRSSLEKKFNSFKKYSPVASVLLKLVNSYPGVDILKNMVEALEKVPDDALSESFFTKKNDIIEALKQASRKIVIFVDDLDRLEPNEAVEILRLVKAVADFPNVIYVLCYDKKILAHSISKAGLADDGMSFLEKIIQVSFCVPQPEGFDLRHWFLEELKKEYNTPPNSDELASFSDRVDEIIDIFGNKYLKTPRDISRVLNALRLHAIPVKENIDLAHMIFLQLIRINNPSLYRWVEEYVNDYACIWDGAYIPDPEREKRAKILDNLLDDNRKELYLTREELTHVLPGIGLDLYEKDPKKSHKIFNDTRDQLVHNLIREKRLASPEHFRFYFALSRPSGALDDREVEQFIHFAERNQDQAIKWFAELARTSRRQGGVMADVLNRKGVPPAMPGWQ